ncbi:MAG: hypothetical protein HYZ68_04865 [Chloroflexi bacterium]|nr:hypothetical protein [Chloroflexota bacterium]
MASLVLLFNTGASWSEEEVRETQEAVEVLWAALDSAGYRVEPVEVQRTLAEALAPFPPEEYLVFNWCE